jgi:shikimate kinase
MNDSANIFLVGPMGAGKTSIGRRLAERLGLRFVDLDALIEAQTGARIAVIFEHEGEAGFRQREHRALVGTATGQGQLVATGGGVVLREDNRACMRASGLVVYLQASVDQQLRRLGRDRTRPLLAAPDRRARLQSLAEQREPLYRAVADIVVPGESDKVEAMTRLVQRMLDEYRTTDVPSA